MGTKGAGGIHAPSRLSGKLRRVRPAVANQLVDALQEMQIGFRIHIERGGTKSWRMQPGPGLRRDDGPAKEMTCRRRPARIGELPPHLESCLALPFGKVCVLVAGEGDGRKSVGLRAQQGV